MSKQKTFKGSFKFFNAEKGYGFIGRPYENDLFVHAHGIVNYQRGEQIPESQLCEFSIMENERGEVADNVILI